MSRNAKERTVFSVLYNESDTFLSSYLDNFLAFTGVNEFLIVNLPPGRTLNTDANRGGSERIHIFNGAVTRKKVGHTLLMGHLESFAEARSLCGEFQLFCSLASNSMMVRTYDKYATERQLAEKRSDPGYDPNELPDTWWWERLKKDPNALRYLCDTWQLKRIWSNQIEGLVAVYSDWATLYSRSSEITEMGQFMDPEFLVPLEEILPSTAIFNFGSGRYTNICHNFWSRYPSSQGKVEIGDLLDLVALYPAHICTMKWFERDPAASETLAVTRPWSRDLFADLAAGTPDGNTNRAHARRILFGKITQALQEREEFMPITQSWSFEPFATPIKCAFTNTSLEAIRQRIPVSMSTADGRERSQAYLLFENTHHILNLAVDIEHSATTKLLITCNSTASADDAPLDASIVEGYLYMNACIGPQCSFRIRIRRPVNESSEGVLRRIVLAQNSEYRRINAWHKELKDEYCDYYYRNDVFYDDSDIWLGVPFFAHTHFEGYVESLSALPASRASYSDGTPQKTISDSGTK